MHIIITHVYICLKQVVLREKWHSLLLVKIAKHNFKYWPNVMATTTIIEYNS